MKKLTFLLVFCHLMAIAQGAPVLSVPYAEVAPKVTADADDSAWKNAAIISQLTLSLGPDAAGLTPTPTEIRLLWDEKFLYVRFLCRDERIESPFQGRDKEHYKGDAVEIFLDPSGTSRDYLELQVSPANQIFDQRISLDAPPVSDSTGRLKDEFISTHFHADPAWNMEGLRTAASRREDGWLTDIALPASAFGLPNWQPSTVRAHLMRYDWLSVVGSERRLIAMNWAPVSYGCPHISPEAMGSLHLLPKK